jgi:hypothetical protein
VSAKWASKDSKGEDRGYRIKKYILGEKMAEISLNLLKNTDP